MATDTLHIDQLVVAAEALSAIMDGAKVELYTNDVVATSTTPLSDFELVDDAWALGKTVAYDEAYRESDNSITLPAASVQFNMDGTADSKTIKGYVIYGYPNIVYHSRPLASPKLMATDLDSLIVNPSITFPVIEYSA